MRRNRKHIRLRAFDYSAPGAYYVTICTRYKERFFGEIMDGIIELSEIGCITTEKWRSIPEHFSTVTLDEFVVMPNHIHGILVLAEHPVGTSHVMSQQVTSRQIPPPCENKFSRPVAGSVSVIVQQFKASVTKWCNENEYGYFQWQGRFHDHVIRNQWSLQNIRRYIRTNPESWSNDDLFNR